MPGVRQQGILSEQRESGGGMDSLIDIPLSFTVKAVFMEGEKIVLSADDGRVLAAEPERFGFRRLIRKRNNPDYEAQAEQDFLSIPTKSRGAADLYRDERGNEWTYNTEIGGYWLTDSASDEQGQAEISCEATTRDELAEMLPSDSVNFSYDGDLELWLGEKAAKDARR
ncbi:hypothetical protein GCM10007362_11890 [Saccharibacillus endophyticus]|uniref:CYTH domain-containing protein n=1 Tax=Saccharibacillus endophyticus TaxID=2060666 RepID=A0ABQ1ZRQ4_9BACL|nr:hypothetical protein GCM10007362_11890 [Saccharibacillus endophyticus]